MGLPEGVNSYEGYLFCLVHRKCVGTMKTVYGLVRLRRTTNAYGTRFEEKEKILKKKKPYTRQAHKRELHPKPFPPSRTHTQHISIIHTNTEGAMGGQRTVCLPSESSRFFLLFLNIPAVADSCIMGVKTPLKIANKPGGGYSGL